MAVLREIREVRNASVGHPTNNARNPDGLRYHFIARSSLAFGRYSLLSYGGGDGRSRSIDCARLIAEQRRCLSEVLAAAIEELQRRDAEHRKEFAMDSLDARVSPASYYMEKVFDALHSPDCGAFGCGMLDLVQKALTDFRDGLCDRGQDTETYDSIKLAYQQVAYPFAKLRAHLSGEETLDPEAAYIFARYLWSQLQAILSAAKEIDEEYRA
jgi:hypothetical protein